MKNRADFLRQYLKWFWLRPENAIMLSIRAEKYQSTFEFFGDVSLDVSCGDGVFSFIAAGGEINFDTDMFQSIKVNSARLGNFDTFDFFDSKYKVNIFSRPMINFSHGTDWKGNLIEKARKLDFYKNLQVHDNNNSLPFSNDYFDYIYSNSAYWVSSFEKHIVDLWRVLKPGGTLVLEIKTNEVLEYSSYRYGLDLLGQRSCEILDAGRMSTWQGLQRLDQYRKIFNELEGVTIAREEPIYGDLLAHIWDIGLRPIFNPLVKLANNVSMQTRNEVKKEWCEIFYSLTEHLVSNYKPEANTAIEWLFVLKKSD